MAFKYSIFYPSRLNVYDFFHSSAQVSHPPSVHVCGAGRGRPLSVWDQRSTWGEHHLGEKPNTSQHHRQQVWHITLLSIYIMHIIHVEYFPSPLFADTLFCPRAFSRWLVWSRWMVGCSAVLPPILQTRATAMRPLWILLVHEHTWHM